MRAEMKALSICEAADGGCGWSRIGIVRREGLQCKGVLPREGRSEGEVTQRHCTLGGQKHCTLPAVPISKKDAMKR